MVTLEKVKQWIFSKTIAACDLKVGRCRRLIEIMKVCERMCLLKVKVISLPYIFHVLYVLCFTGPRYQVSVYRTIGPLVIHVVQTLKHLLYSLYLVHSALSYFKIALKMPRYISS